MKKSFGKNLSISQRLVISFAIVVMLMLLGSAVALRQFSAMRAESERLNQVDLQGASLSRVHNDIMVFRDVVQRSVDLQDAERMAVEVTPFRQSFLADIDRATESLRALPSDAQRHALNLALLESVRASFPSQADSIMKLAAVNNWQVAQLHLDNQMKKISQLTGDMVKEVDDEVAVERAQSLEQLRRVHQRAIATLLATAFLTLVSAAGLGFAATRGIATPLERLDAGVRALTRGDFEHRVEVTGNDEIAGLARVFNDMTSRLRDLYEALQRSEAHFRSLIENASDLITVLNADGTIRYVSPSSVRVAGYAPEVLVGRNAAEFIHPDDASLARSVLARSEEVPGVPVGMQFRFRHQDESWRTLDAVATSLLDDPAVKGIVVNSRDITEQMQGANALRENQRLLQAIIDNSKAVIYVKDLAGRFLLINRRFEEIFHINRESAIGQTGHALFTEERADAFRAFDQRVLSAGAAMEAEEVAPQDDGLHTYISIKCPLFNAAGEAYAVCGISTDITDRKKADAVREGESRVLEMIASSAPLEDILARLTKLVEDQSEGMLCSVVLLDEDGLHLRHCAAPSLPEAYIKAIDGESIGPQAGSCGTAMYQKAPVIVTDIKEDPLWENYRDIAARHGLRACWSIPIFSSQDDVLGSFAMYYREVRSPSPAETRFFGPATHIAGIAIERKRAEEGLRKSAEEISDLYNNAPCGYHSLDEDGTFIRINDTGLKWLGYKRDEVIGKMNVTDIISPENSKGFQKYFSSLKEQGWLSDVEFEMVRKDGTTMPVLLSATSVRDADGSFLMTNSTLFEITERKKLEEQLRQSQKMEAIGRLAGGIAHDFNNLLTAILGYSDLLLHHIPRSDATYGMAADIGLAAQRAAALTQQLLAFSRRQILQPKVINLNETVANMDKMLRRLIGEDIDLLTIPDPQIGLVKADPGQVEQVIVNLAVNARDAMPRGGRLTLETARVYLDEEYARRHSPVGPGPYVTLAISDTGCGMDAETQSHIFEPFFTTKEPGKGTGLGLSTVYGIVKQSGGYIWAYSEPGHGTSFKIYLPSTEELGSPPGAAGPSSLAQGTETVLLVEDEPVVRRLAATILREAGYTVLEASDGEQALKVAFDNSEMRIHLLATDVVMPKIGGAELAEQIKTTRPDILVLFLSGYTTNATLHQSLEQNAAFLQKPFTPSTLAATIREILDKGVRPKV